MTKKRMREQLLPIVIITFQDHSAHLEGLADPVIFTAVGVLLKETVLGYRLGHWVKPKMKPSEKELITSYVAKVRGMSIKTIGHWKNG